MDSLVGASVDSNFVNCAMATLASNSVCEAAEFVCGDAAACGFNGSCGGGLALPPPANPTIVVLCALDGTTSATDGGSCFSTKDGAGVVQMAEVRFGKLLTAPRPRPALPPVATAGPVPVVLSPAADPCFCPFTGLAAVANGGLDPLTGWTSSMAFEADSGADLIWAAREATAVAFAVASLRGVCALAAAVGAGEGCPRFVGKNSSSSTTAGDMPLVTDFADLVLGSLGGDAGEPFRSFRLPAKGV